MPLLVHGVMYNGYYLVLTSPQPTFESSFKGSIDTSPPYCTGMKVKPRRWRVEKGDSPKSVDIPVGALGKNSAKIESLKARSAGDCREVTISVRPKSLNDGFLLNLQCLPMAH